MTDQNEFEQIGKKQRKSNLLLSFWRMIIAYRKWWLIPIVGVLLMLSLLVLLGGSAAAPFIYSLF